MADFDQALEHLLSGDATVFLGAGFSLGAKNLRGESFKDGKALSAYLSKLAGTAESLPLDDASEDFARIRGEDALIQELQQEYVASAIADTHLRIAKLPWRRVYTTNYDNVLESAYAHNGRRLTPVTAGDRILSIPKTDTISVHLNGFIDRLTRDSLWTDFKLTDSSYVSGSLHGSQWIVLFRQDLHLSRAVFFIGYSVSDLDIKRILYETPDLQAKTFFILGPNPDPQTVRRASRYGSVLPLNAESFAQAVESKLKSYTPPEGLDRIGRSISRFTAPTVIPQFSDRAVLDLLLLGAFEPAFIWQSLHDGQSYYRERPSIVPILARLDAGGGVAVLHSDLGNGKTLLLEGVKCGAYEHGFSVFTVHTRTEDLFDELEEVVQAPSKVLVVIDDYSAWMDAIQFLGIHSRPDLRLLLTARSSIHDVTADRLASLLPERPATEYALDTLAESDLEWLADLCDEYGLWGENAGWSRHRKLEHLARTCDGQLHAFLLTVLQSPTILARFTAVLEELKLQRGYSEVVLSILVLTMLNYRPTIDTLLDLWGDQVLDVQFRKNGAIRQLMDVAQGKIVLRSSVAAEVLLRQASDANKVVDVLISMARIADQARHASPLYWELLKDLTRFSSMQLLLPESQRRAAVVRYYENTKNLAGCANNPHFWLQYAIACLMLEDFDRTARYFDTAYSLARGKDNYNTFMFDTHYARFLLMRAIRGKDPRGPMAGFRDARTILNEQLKAQHLHYPYRVATLYGDFFETFQTKLTGEQRAEVTRAAKYVADQAARLPDERRSNRYVRDCEKALARIFSAAA